MNYRYIVYAVHKQNIFDMFVSYHRYVSFLHVFYTVSHFSFPQTLHLEFWSVFLLLFPQNSPHKEESSHIAPMVFHGLGRVGLYQMKQPEWVLVIVAPQLQVRVQEMKCRSLGFKKKKSKVLFSIHMFNFRYLNIQKFSNKIIHSM